MSTTTTIITHPDGTKITVATTTAATAPPPAQIKYLLSINTGRSGSDYLTELLNHADNAVSVHEGFPLMNGDVMLDYNNGNVEPMKELMQMKVSQMDAVRGEKDVYCETNHSFVKGWGWLLPELVPQEQIGVIIMTREKEAIVNSLLRLHDVPGASFFSKTWYCDPAASGNLLPAPDGTPQTHPLEHCRWYIDEIAARAAKYKQTFPGIRFFDTTLENLNRVDQVAKMFDFFGLRPKESLNAVIGVPLNQRGEWPKLKRDELVVPPKYPNPDALPTDERRKLVQSMVSYLVDERLTNEIAELKEPDNAYVSGTLMQAAQTIVTPLLRELEERFKFALFFTNTEFDVIFRFVMEVTPDDDIIRAFAMDTDDGFAPKFDGNWVVTPEEIARRLGKSGESIGEGMTIGSGASSVISKKGTASM